MNPQEKIDRLENGLRALGKMLEAEGVMEGEIAKTLSVMLKLIRE